MKLQFNYRLVQFIISILKQLLTELKPFKKRSLKFYTLNLKETITIVSETMDIDSCINRKKALEKKTHRKQDIKIETQNK